jgi:hypothetical protein
MSLEERCYVIYGNGFKALKIKGASNKNKLVDSLKLKGFSPKSSQLNPQSAAGKKCKSTPTSYLNNL